MEERNKAIVGCIVFGILILALGIGGYIVAFGNDNHKTKEQLQQEDIVKNKIDASKEYIYFEEEKVISNDLNIVYKNPIINLSNTSAKAVNEELKSENNELLNSVKKISETQNDTEKEIVYNTDDIYSATIRDYESYEYNEYASLVVSTKEYDCFDGLSNDAKFKSYVFDTKKNERVSNMDLFLKYDVTINNIKEQIKEKLSKEQITNEDGTETLKIDETLEGITNNNYALYIDNDGVLVLKYIVKSNNLDYNDNIEIKGE